MIEHFLQRVEKKAFRIALMAVKNEQDALDLVQNTMMKLVENEAWRRGIGARGQHTIRTEYSAQAIGQLMRKRLEKLNRI